MTIADAPAAQGTAQDHLLATFARIKQGHAAFSIPLADGAGRLIPVTEAHDGDVALIATIADWRACNAFAFPTQFTVTLDGTARWLRLGLLDVPDRLLYLVQASDGTLIGHLGFANCAAAPGVMEIDNVVRGVKAGAPGIMAAAMHALTRWAAHEFSPREIFLRVFSDNRHAVRFYERCGYRHDTMLPLRRTSTENAISYAPPAAGDTAAPDTYFARMVLTR
jgi:RimJ/RimL family protein N-acetyltransferase